MMLGRSKHSMTRLRLALTLVTCIRISSCDIDSLWTMTKCRYDTFQFLKFLRSMRQRLQFMRNCTNVVSMMPSLLAVRCMAHLRRLPMSVSPALSFSVLKLLTSHLQCRMSAGSLLGGYSSGRTWGQNETTREMLQKRIIRYVFPFLWMSLGVTKMIIHCFSLLLLFLFSSCCHIPFSSHALNLWIWQSHSLPLPPCFHYDF